MPPRKPKTPDCFRLLDVLELRPTPDPNFYAPHTRGLKTRLGICLFIAQLFQLNEALPAARKISDAEILRQIVEEFPEAGLTKRLLKRLLTVNQLRIQYNHGQLTARRRPAVVSHRFDARGRAVDGRTGTRLLDATEQTA